MIAKPSNRIILQIILFTCLLFIPDKDLLAQSVRYEIEEILNTKELEGFTGKSILQDSDGFMWFGSRQGLYRYDGASFKRYIYDPSRNKGSVHDPTGLVSDYVFSLIEDSEGTIWFANYYVLTRFDRRTETFKHYTDTLIIAPITCIVEGMDGYLWVGSGAGLSRFDKKTETFLSYPTYSTEKSGSPRISVTKIYEDNAGNLWIVHANGITNVFNRETGTFKNIENTPPHIHNFLEDRSNRFWITSGNGLYQFNKKSKTFRRYLYLPHDPDHLTSQYVAHILEDAIGHIWINTDDGIYKYSENLKKLNFWRYPGENTPEWQKNPLKVDRSLYMDNTGTIWFFTIKGIGKLIKRLNNFTIYEPAKAPDIGLIDTSTSNRIYIWSWEYNPVNQSDGGIYLLNRETHICTRLVVDSENYIENFGFLVSDCTGTLWVATKGRGLYKGIISKDGKVKFENVFSNPSDSTNVPNLFIHHLFEDSKGRIWIEARGHLPSYYDPEQDRIMHLVNNPKSTDKLPDIKDKIPGISDMGFTRGSVQGETNSGILLATFMVHGIFAIIPPLIRISEHAVMPTDIIRFRSESGENMIKGANFYQSPNDSTGTIWTKGIWPISNGFQKITLLDHETKNSFIVSSRIYTIKDGLPCHQIARFLEDDNGNFWIGTYRGLSKFNPSKETFTNYTVQDGLPSNVFISSAVKSNDGEMFFGTVQGFISFYPDSIRYKREIPPVMLTGLKINQQSISPGESSILDKLITYSDFIELSYNQNNISLEFAALNYIQSGRNQYKYKLEGFNDDWIHAGNRTNVDYTNLKPGSYTFRVSGSNNDGVWNEEGASLQIIIHSPPWKTVWAYIIYGFILIGIILWYRSFLLNRAKIRTALEVERVEKENVQKLDHMKSRFFANISHEFRTPLTLLLGPIEDLLKSKPDRDNKERGLFKIMQRNARRLQLLINQLLDLSKLETGKVKLQVFEGDFTEFIRAIILSFLSHAESKKIDYQYDIPVQSGPVYYDADKLEKILTNLISNAFKFTPANGKVSVSLQYVTSTESGDPQYANIKVSDTGKGIPEEQLEKIFDRFYQVSDSDKRDAEGTGIGLALTKELIDLYRGEISIESEVGKGSTFMVKLPVSREQFKEEEIVTITPDKEVIKEPMESELGQTETELVKMKESQNLGKTKDAPVILIAEDNIDLYNYISKNLGDSYQILAAENGKKGLELAIENIPDLVISDLMMPVMDGMEMCRQLKTDERTNHIPVVMLTAKADRESKMEGLKIGADDYIIKPFDAGELQVRVSNLIQQRKKLRERYRKELIDITTYRDIPPPEDEFMVKVMNCINRHLKESDYNVKKLGDEMRLSRIQLYRKIIALTDYPPSLLIRNMRLKMAARMFMKGHKNVTSVMYTVGFSTPSHFTKCFRELFGLNPSKYIKQRTQSIN